MALEIVKNHENVAGNLKIKYYRLTFTGVTGGVIPTGSQNVKNAIYTPSTGEAHDTYINSASASVTQDDLGFVYIDGVSSGSTGILKVDCI